MTDAYKSAGVDIHAGYDAVTRIKTHARRTLRPGVLGGIGSFGGAFDLSSLNMKEPILISGTDGVGTKLMLAFAMDRHDTIGIDAVAMCVNDIVTQGAEPLYFLDYIACGRLNPEKVEQIVKGIATGCEQAGCALIGGETAEMPGMYDEEEYDLAGFSVGAVEKKQLISGRAIREGDALIGLASNGIHSNGYSLVRKVLLGDSYENLNEPFEKTTLGDELLKPTRIYVKPILAALKTCDIHGMAHITGGGFVENIPRMLPVGMGATIQIGSWQVPPIFNDIATRGELSNDEMFSTFNMGVGMVIAVPPRAARETVAFFDNQGEKAFIIGEVTGESGILFKEAFSR